MAEFPTYIGLTGTNAAGKGTVAEILRSMGYSYISLSDEIRRELKSRGMEETRENLIKVGNELRGKFGFSVLADRVKERLRSGEKVVIDSIRSPFEAESLKKLPGFFLLAVDAPVELRFKRARARGRVENASTLEEFIEIENRERSSEAGRQQLDKTMSMADAVVINDSTVEDLKKKLEEVLSL